MDTKNFKVAKIINDTSLVINAGSEQGINKGDKFKIIGKLGNSTVIDPDTGENLGTLDDIKGEVIAAQIYPHMSICNSQIITSSPYQLSAQPILQNSLAGLISSMNGESHREQLNVDKTQVTGGFKKSNKPIQIGDIAQLI